MENLGFFGLLAKGYLYKKCKEDFGHTNCEGKLDYISSFLKSNDSYKIRRDNGEEGFINCYLYTYLPGKCGCHLMLGLAEGSRRFGAAYFSYLIGKYPLKTIPCKLTIEHLDERLVKRRVEEYKRFLKPSTLPLKFLREMRKERFEGYSLRKSFSKALNIIKFKSRCLKTLEKALVHQRMMKPVLDNVLSIVKGKSQKLDFIKTYEQVRNYRTKLIRNPIEELKELSEKLNKLA